MWTLSVCIPIYNSDVRALVNNLCTQIDQLGTTQIDIVLIDDASEQRFVELNQSQNPRVHYIGLTENIGRSKIRNTFLQHTQADYLLFIDGDSTILDPQFLEKYFVYITARPIEVLVGASVYQNSKPPRAQHLRWKYSTQRESLNYGQRSQAQHAGFKTNNFVIHRNVFARFLFDERITSYGHEDTLLGLQLSTNGVVVAHIDNPVWNLKLDTNAEFLIKTDSALKNLLRLQKMYPNLSIQDRIRLLGLYSALKKNSLSKHTLDFLLLTIPFITSLLKSGYATLFWFDLYRLLRLHQLDKDTTHKLN
jgi:glycosyltransferase involved in cell wall biosynthesis